MQLQWLTLSNFDANSTDESRIIEGYEIIIVIIVDTNYNMLVTYNIYR